MKSYDEFNGPVNHFIKNNSTAPIHIKFKHGSYEKVYFVYDTDTTDKLYDSILGTTSNEDLIFEDMKLPRGLTIEEAGFFPGMNYVTVKNINPKFLVEKEFFIKLNFIDTDSIDLKIKEDATVNSICKMYGEKYILIKNGSYLDMSFKIKDVFNCGECVDLVERSLCE
ncbi:hypothetical protein A0H76_1159 [Hepatospora eriocheir]|uniref:Uncharacterized protein n=1 Tax=Hepatospora eriocheir TaxID=1081669 RepID=A0A1X0QHJ1_9MICR|nr:hypothetical protein A0H76_1159 [Hepatospora eriocheir]